jgi:predicted DNA binding CopG/RHH family protein
MAFIDSGQDLNREKTRKKMRKLMENMDRTKFTIRIPTHRLKKLKKKLMEKDSNVSRFLNDMILKYIDK